MRRVYRPLVLPVFVCLLAGCATPDRSVQPTAEVTQLVRRGGRAPMPTAVATHLPTPESSGLSLPTAVRVFSVDPQEVVLGPSDLPPGFHVAAEYPTRGLEFDYPQPHGLRPPPQSADGGVGQRVVLARGSALDTDGVASIATTAVRYETTVGATAALADAVTAADPPYATVLGHARLGEDGRARRYRVGAALIDEILFRTRNYLLGVTLIRELLADDPQLALHIADLVRLRLPD
jgi:hypothetical protein